MKKLLFSLALILFIGSFVFPFSGAVIKTRLFEAEFAQDIPKEEKVTPFIFIPNQSPENSESQIKLLSSIFNFKNIGLKEESTELEWKPVYKANKKFFPTITQNISLENSEYQMSLIPVDDDDLKYDSFRIKIFLVKSTEKGGGASLHPLKLIYEKVPSGKILDVEIRDFGSLIFIFIPFEKRVYVLSIYQSFFFGGIV